MRNNNKENGMDYCIDRRGSVSQWSVMERRVLDSTSSQEIVPAPSTATLDRQVKNGILRCKLINARSLCNKLNILLLTSDFDHIFVTET